MGSSSSSSIECITVLPGSYTMAPFWRHCASQQVQRAARAHVNESLLKILFYLFDHNLFDSLSIEEPSAMYTHNISGSIALLFFSPLHQQQQQQQHYTHI